MSSTSKPQDERQNSSPDKTDIDILSAQNRILRDQVIQLRQDLLRYEREIAVLTQRLGLNPRDQ